MTEVKESIRKTIKEHVIDDHRKTQVFKKHGLDFCCGGNDTIENACLEVGLDPEQVYRDLEHLENQSNDEQVNQSSMQLTDLVQYILEKHHAYVNETAPIILQYLRKVVNVHGSRHPQLEKIYNCFQEICAELTDHMQKEEIILFPYIEVLEAHQKSNLPMSPPPFGIIRNPIDMMEQEHQAAGDHLKTIRTLTNNFTPPEDVCATFQITYKYLEEFEADMHEHIHLENNILFPKAEKLEEYILIG